jgi:uncharacterized protein (DUF433 family)
MLYFAMSISERPIQLESYFEFINDGEAERVLKAIRIVGTRVGIEFVLSEYLEGATADEIALRFPTLTLEQIYATITYYLADREFVDEYLRHVWNHMDKAAREQDVNPSPFIVSLRERLQAARQRATPAS